MKPFLGVRAREIAATALSAAVITALLLFPAFYNGFPLLFSDSGEYFGLSIQPEPLSYRTFGYPLWLAAMWPAPSMWAGVVAQSALLGVLLWQLSRALTPGLATLGLIGGAAVLVLVSAAPWISSQLMPDIFAPITVIAVYLTALHRDRMSLLFKAIAFVGIAFGVMTHATHLWLAVGLLLVFAVAAWRRRVSAAWRGIAHAAVAVAVGVAIIVTINFAKTGKLFFSRGGHVFVLAHLVETGFAQRVLAEDCPSETLPLCPYRGELTMNAKDFIWAPTTPLRRIGGFDVSGGQTWSLLRKTIARYPVDFSTVAVKYTARQMAALWTFDGLESYANVPYISDFVGYFLPEQYGAFRTARQQQGEFARARAVPRAHIAVAVICALASVWLLIIQGRRVGWHLETLPGFHLTVWLALIGNAALCANLSGVFDRYQTRLTWLLPLAVLLSLAELIRSRIVKNRLGKL